jgi:High potential iron-sulfur protein
VDVGALPHHNQNRRSGAEEFSVTRANSVSLESKSSDEIRQFGQIGGYSGRGIWLTEFSRRSLLQGAAGTVGAGMVFGTTMIAASAARVSQSSVSYQGSPKGDQRCNNCRQFQPPHACKMVEGRISSQGWCVLWVKAGGA